jgi:hypothetical protein
MHHPAFRVFLDARLVFAGALVSSFAEARLPLIGNSISRWPAATFGFLPFAAGAFAAPPFRLC